MQDKQEPPVKVGDEVTVVIRGVGEKGDGFAKVNSFVIFVPGTKKKERVKIRITKVFPTIGFAEVIERVKKEEVTDVTVEELKQPIPEPSYKDSEDFGADLPEED
ncbi:TRAM domain-containing protein [Candidatus Woesearchaeota archaeon]|nr:TRAM domain-containing protein [Candidatus Woesearchaeota archaeon]